MTTTILPERRESRPMASEARLRALARYGDRPAATILTIIQSYGRGTFTDEFLTAFCDTSEHIIAHPFTACSVSHEPSLVSAPTTAKEKPSDDKFSQLVTRNWPALRATKKPRPFLSILRTLADHGIDCNGLDYNQQKRIEEVGLDRWIDEVGAGPLGSRSTALASTPILPPKAQNPAPRNALADSAEAESLEAHIRWQNPAHGSAPDVERHFSLSGPTPGTVHPSVASELPGIPLSQETVTDSPLAAPQVIENRQSKNADLGENGKDDARTPTTENGPLPVTSAGLSVTSPAKLSVPRRSPVRLTNPERETALRLGLQPCRPSTRSVASSVLDAYPPLQRTGRKSSGLSKNLLVKSVVEQDERCAYCDRRFGSAVLIDSKVVLLRPEPDHFVPRAKRLNNSTVNIVAACQVCNMLKTSRVFESMAQARQVLQAAWAERGWSDAPPLVPFKRTLAICNN